MEKVKPQIFLFVLNEAFTIFYKMITEIQ